MSTQEVYDNLYELKKCLELTKNVGKEADFIWVSEEFYEAVCLEKEWETWEKQSGVTIVVSDIDRPFMIHVKPF